MDNKSVGRALMVGSYGPDSLQSSNRPAAAAAVALVAGNEDLDVALLGALSAAFPEVGAEELQVFAEDLRACVRPPELKLKDLDSDQVELLQSMPTPVWTILQQFALAGSGPGICSVVLNEDSVIDTTLIDGLKQLGTLKHVSVPGRTISSRIDFSALQGLETVHITGDPGQALAIYVPAGVTVHATKTSATSLQKSLVYYTGSQGMGAELPVVLGESRPLQGSRYYRTADKHFDSAASAEEAQIWSAELNVNAGASMEVTNGHTGKTTRQPIVCRHLALRWLDTRIAHRKARDASGPQAASAALTPPDEQVMAATQAGQRFSYGDFLSPQDVSKNIDERAEIEFDHMTSQGADALFDGRSPGSMLAGQFSRLRPGQSSHHIITTTDPGHALGLELRVRMRMHGGQMRPEYVVNVYDPNSTGTHQHLVVNDPAKLVDMELGDWLHSSHIAFLYDRPSVRGRLKGEVRAQELYLPETPFGSGAVIHAAVEGGHTALVRDSMKTLVAQASSLGKERLEVELAGKVGPFRALHTAAWHMPRSWPEALTAYVQEVLAIPDSVLDADAKRRLLRAEEDEATVLGCTLEFARGDSMKAFVEVVLASPALTPQQRLDLLMSPTPGGQPMLHACCSRMLEPPLSEPQRLAGYDTLRDFVAMVVSSPTLSLDDKKVFCASAMGPEGAKVPAVKHALDVNGDRGAAAAIVLGILESATDAGLRKTLLGQLGVTPQEVIAVFRSRLQHPDDRGWSQALAAQIEKQVLRLAAA